MIEPQAITIPILFSVLPNPSDKLFIIVSVSRPPINPIASDAAIRVKKG